MAVFMKPNTQVCTNEYNNMKPLLNFSRALQTEVFLFLFLSSRSL